MDSLTQVVLGATVASACVPKEHRRKAALIGAGLGTLPDLDVFIDYGNAVANFTLHRGFSHSLLVLIPFAAILWYVLKRMYEPVKTAPRAWFWAITLTLVTHTLLDAHTAYGTQLFWPLDVTPTMWSTLFIIDPLYTLPLLLAFILVVTIPRSIWSKRFITAGLILSTLYLGWSWVAKLMVYERIEQVTASTDAELKVFTTPTPFNTLMWRIVIVGDETYQEGYFHFLHPDEITFNTHIINRDLFDQSAGLASVNQLQWFANGFNRADIIDDALVITDLRMGFEDNYVFRHKVAIQEQDNWQEISSIMLPRQLDGDDLGEFKEMFFQRKDSEN